MPDLAHEYAQLKAEATRMAGELTDIPRRAVLLHDLYCDSGENHVFPLIAAHGALWAWSFFEVGGRLGRWIAWRYFYNSTERAYRLGLLEHFAEGFREVNRCVCIDTYANYHFTKRFGREPGADQVIRPELVHALNQVHRAREAGNALTADVKRLVFETSFEWEQELTVAPGVKKAVESFDCRIMRALCTKPFVRFSYFPRFTYFWFRNFADKAERIARGQQAYRLGEQAGWANVREAMRVYRILPDEFFAEPKEYSARFRQQLLEAV